MNGDEKISSPDDGAAAPEGALNETDGALTLAVNLDGDQVGAGWGKARTVAVAVIANARIVSWEEHDVRWDLSHDSQQEGRHHADIVTFLRDHGVQVVVTGHMGPPMANTLQKLGVIPLVNATGDARSAALEGAALVLDGRDDRLGPDAREAD